ncbi:membrane associated domain-containing protein [Elsinoe australis]|uniref:Membrane associated domain-containing protein n=1 Tax=Elsinoe australis TaxID=40998 RepID=A0A2P8ABH7_9PEZI|nr:hypothetical protein B9Z65_9014 [Elsinoe australis]TKX27496.1 membrane associated domain-containing protein [Elsinoe australis]
MAIMDTLGRFMLPLRIVQAVFTFIVLVMTAYVAHWWAGYWRAMSPSQINFLVFTSVWTILALIYLVLSQWRFERFAHKYAILGVETLTMLFWFAGFIALAVFLSDRVCFGNVCNSAKAAAAFAAFEWVFFAITTTMATIHVFRTRGTTENKAAPEMAAHPSA